MSLSLPEIDRFAEKYKLARQEALQSLAERGTCGLELEWNMLDADFRPLQTVGSGPDRRSFVDALKADFLPDWQVERSQLEVFHWMIEWVTRPYYSPVGAVYESRLLEACLTNALARAGRSFGERLYFLHGNLLSVAEVGHDSIPGGWNLAKRRYLERCVDLYGPRLATAGIHANLSFPEPLLAWDFMHLSPSERGDEHLDSYKNRVYIEGTRLMRAFAALFIATSASTPLRPALRDGQPVVELSEFDSVRSLTFPSPETLDLPHLYRSHADYLRISYDLVRRGVRFGNNNWTAVRARSFAEPVERLIAVSSDQLHSLYRRGLYASGETETVDDMAEKIVIQNLLARIDLPMARVEVRTDEGGHPLELDIANLAFKELLLIQFYADPTYGRAFRYDGEDLARARRNEHSAAEKGLGAEIEDPFTGKPIAMRDFLRRTLDEIGPLTEALERRDLLGPLREMADGAPNTACRIREELRRKLGKETLVPVDLLREWAEKREAEVERDVERIAGELVCTGEDSTKWQELLGGARDEARREPGAPIRFQAPLGAWLGVSFPNKTAEIIDLAKQLIRIPSVTNAPPGHERLDEVHRAATLIYDYLRQAELEVRIFDKGRYPAVLASFPGQGEAPVMLCGHFDVVAADPDESQFDPTLDGDYLRGRGAADMKTVVATYLVWMKDVRRRPTALPGINLLLVGNEEIGEGEPAGTPHILGELRGENGYAPQLLIAGERTGERGDELMGEVCVENRGLVRLEVSVRGERGHTGMAGAPLDLSVRLFRARDELMGLLEKRLTLKGDRGWQSQVRFPFVRVGEDGIFNITASRGILGIEIRPIPQDRISGLVSEIKDYCRHQALEVRVVAAEDGIVCPRGNPFLGRLLQSVREAFGRDPILGRKLPATSARFAPDGQGVVWGQSGVGPHAADERHFLPSIAPYYQALDLFGERCRDREKV
jgi:acetylornithine deacetylase/succinyl-diaminopimelate desuccinylase-like protein/gamma-glutamyl:cysteine ligase YbdK (ATP-grasp superfamily)